MPINHNLSPSHLRRKARNVALGTLAVGALFFGIFSNRSNHTHVTPSPTPSTPKVLTGDQLAQNYALNAPIIAPDGHSILEIGSSPTNPEQHTLFLSDDSGRHYRLVATNVDAAVWSPYVEDGNDQVFAVLQPNIDNQVDAQGNEGLEQDSLFITTGDGSATRVTEANGRSSHLTYDFGPSHGGVQDTYYWDQDKQGDVVFTNDLVIGSERADGQLQIYGEQDVQISVSLVSNGK